jgi:4-diphosphocytidyl-2-C-methyl-D-erythritol kinase
VILALPARAKLNLSLAVTGRLPDGRHALATRFQAIALHDLLETEVAAETRLEVAGDAPAGPDNLVLEAHRALELAAGRRLPTFFRLHKCIPSGAGLGGGSSDAATALRAISSLHRLDLDLRPIARALGSDVAFFLCGGAADAWGAGDVLRPAPIAEGWFALAWPGFEVSTAAVYAEYDRVGGEAHNHLERAAHAVEPRLAAYRARLGEGWQMTGSGAAYFRRTASREAAEEAIAGMDGWTCVTRPIGGWC